jgi:hypothetical protein
LLFPFPCETERCQLDFGHAAIDVKLCARHMAGLIGSQELDSFRDLVRVFQPTEWSIIRHFFLHPCERRTLSHAF